MTVDINPKANSIWFKPLAILFGAILFNMVLILIQELWKLL